MPETRQLTLEQLARSAGMTPRNVRAYQSRGLLPPPLRNGRTAWYGPEHVGRLRLVRALHERGLSLQVVHDLLEQGTAEAELARLTRELRQVLTRAEPVPVTPSWVERLERTAPGLMQELVDTGVLVEGADGLVASPTVLGLGGVLYGRGCEFDVSARVMVAGGLAAAASASAVAPEIDDRDAEDVQLIVQLAAAAYADVLARRLGVGQDGVSRPGR